MKIVCCFFFILISSFLAVNAQKLSQSEYINQYKDLAISEMKRSGVPASITLAQGIIETESGNSNLLLRSNNHFGIKCKSTWQGPSVNHDDDEKDECFRAYQNAEESYRDHSDFLRSSPRYAFLFDLAPTDYVGWAHGLKTAGYATNPKYPDILIRFIETYNLHQYDTKAIIDASVASGENLIHPPDEIISATLVKEAPVGVLLPYTAREINHTKAIYVPSGTSLLAVATRYNIKLSRLLEFNDMKKDGILSESQFIFLERKKNQGQTEYYVAGLNETLYHASQKNGVQIQSLLEYNPFSENEPLPSGTQVYLKARSKHENSVTSLTREVSPTSTRQTTPAQIILHRVQPKEGLYAISKMYGVTIEELKTWNNLQDDKIQIGQEINIIKN